MNTCLNEIRRLGADKNRRVAGFTAVFGGRGDDGEGSVPLADERSEAPGDGMDASETESHVRAAIDALPAQQRLAVVLSRYHALPYEEVAEAMDSSVPAVKSLLTGGLGEEFADVFGSSVDYDFFVDFALFIVLQ